MDELAALVALNEVDLFRGNKLADLYSRSHNFSAILRAYNRHVDPSNLVVQYRDRGIYLVPFWSDDYPVSLKEVDGRPLLLYVKGDLSVLRRPMMAVVGSRRVSPEAKKKTFEVVDEIIKQELVVVSGLAKGIDTLAHRRTLIQGGKTVAVLAHGLDHVYPAENTELAEEIVKSGGAIVSEMPWEAKIEKKYFLARNRIVVGMSQGVVVVEAGERSGSLASANWAAEMGREVFAIPGTPGCDALIEDGATAI